MKMQQLKNIIQLFVKVIFLTYEKLIFRREKTFQKF